MFYGIKHKCEVFKIVKKWKVEDLRLSINYHVDVKIKKLRSDKRGEYNSAKFETFCEEYRTIMQRTVSCTPQQNKVAERMNQTLSERFRNFIQAYEKCFGKRQSAQLHNTICTYIFDIVLRFYVIPYRRILGDFLEGVL